MNEPEEQATDDQTSDIDIIEEDEDLSSSIVSQLTNLSFLQDLNIAKSNNRLTPEYVQDDLSESSSLVFCTDEIPNDLEMKPGVRAYVHTPNSKLNVRLNLMLALTITAVVGLGIGNFLGWSTNKNQQNQLSIGQVMKLKQLQDELVICMQNQAKDAKEEKFDKNAKVINDFVDFCLVLFDFMILFYFRFAMVTVFIGKKDLKSYFLKIVV